MKTQYEAIRQYVRDNHGANFQAPEVQQFLEAEKQLFTEYQGKLVKIIYHALNDFAGSGGEKIGRIQILKDGSYFFLPKGKRSNGFHLTTGLFDGWHATISVMEILPA